jgi:hypothetical protein
MLEQDKQSWNKGRADAMRGVPSSVPRASTSWPTQVALAEKYRKWGQAFQVSHPFVAAKLLMALAKTYDHEASREDTEAGIRRRLR